MSKFNTIANAFLFYIAMFIFCIFFSGGCETVFWYIPTLICVGYLYWMGKTYSENDWREFTGVNLIQKYTGVDIFAED